MGKKTNIHTPSASHLSCCHELAQCQASWGSRGARMILERCLGSEHLPGLFVVSLGLLVLVGVRTPAFWSYSGLKRIPCS